MISGADVQQLTNILAGKGIPADDDVEWVPRRALPRCGFANARGRELLPSAARSSARPRRARDTTEVYQVDETGELRPVDLEQVTHEGATLVIRAGRRALRRGLQHRRRAHDDRAQPRCRDIPRRRDGLAQPRAAGAQARRPLHRRSRLAQRHLREPPEDRVHRLQNGDELQVGKYKLTYLDER